MFHQAHVDGLYFKWESGRFVLPLSSNNRPQASVSRRNTSANARSKYPHSVLTSENRHLLPTSQQTTMALGAVYSGFAPEVPDAYFDLHNNGIYLPLSLFTTEMRDLVSYRPDVVLWRGTQTKHGWANMLDIDELLDRYAYWETTLGPGRWQDARDGYIRFSGMVDSTELCPPYYTWTKKHFARVQSFGTLFSDFKLILALDIEMRKLYYKLGDVPGLNDALYAKRWQQLVAWRDEKTPLPVINHRALLTAELPQTGQEEAFH
ncbi:hypothetical protein Hypma_016379 [Hypsizygus marmoreus]|uniref:Uncharacterized protein n=1 Tax=Hypsizygus marmoreus TaxID=39966 RepID=A0A369J2H1_HYPMA|nr:hypothetical protein Hypma_016379 [Hypsizygus marmoreus]